MRSFVGFKGRVYPNCMGCHLRVLVFKQDHLKYKMDSEEHFI